MPGPADMEAANMSEAKTYEVEGLTFEFTPNGSPFEGLLMVTTQEATFSAAVNLTKLRSRGAWAKGMAENYGADVGQLKRALNEICTLRTEEVAAAERAEQAEDYRAKAEPEILSEEAEALVSSPGVLSRYVEDVARIRGVVRDRDALRLQSLVAFGAQLAPLPSGRPAGANLILTAEAGRGLVYDLRPPALDELGLIPAIRERATDYGRGGLDVGVEAPESLPPLPAAVEVAAYRIIQEALTNVTRHARAGVCRLRLSVREGEIELEVADDGVGLPEDRHGGVGIASMRERAAELGGTCEVAPIPGGGTRMLARLPLPEWEEEP